MSLSDLASLGSFVSGFAVLISLIFLYFQLRQVNRQVRQAEINQRSLVGQTRTAQMGMRQAGKSTSPACAICCRPPPLVRLGAPSG
jgi:hypothetical protein